MNARRKWSRGERVEVFARLGTVTGEHLDGPMVRFDDAPEADAERVYFRDAWLIPAGPNPMTLHANAEADAFATVPSADVRRVAGTLSNRGPLPASVWERLHRIGRVYVQGRNGGMSFVIRNPSHPCER